MNVDVRGHHRNENDIRTARKFGKALSLECGWRINDERVSVLGHATLAAPGNGSGSLIAGDAIYGRLLGLSFCKPPHTGALRIQIHERGPASRHSEIGGQIRGKCCLAASAPGIQKKDSLYIDRCGCQFHSD